MILAEFLSFKKFDIEEDVINNPTSFTVDSLTQAISDSINLLKPIRPSSQRTAKVIKSIMEKHMKKREIGGYYDEHDNRVPDTWVYERTIESDILKLWLYRFSEQNLSYNNAYNALVPYLNTGNTFPINLRQIEDSELLEFIRKDDDEEIQHDKSFRKKISERTKITIHSQGLKISGDADLDKNWEINKREADDENFRRKELAEKRENLLNELGNKIILATDETTLIQARVELLNLERINIGWKYSNLDELVCTDDLGNEIWLRSGETKTFEEREKEINSLKELIENKLLLLSKTNKSKNSDLNQTAAISKGDATIERQLAQEFAAITRPLSTSFPSFRTYAALKLKKQPAQLKKALLDDFNEFNLMIDLVPNNESERQNMIDQLDSFSIQYPDWNFDIEESKKIVMDLKDGRRDEIIYNTICNINDLKSNHDYRNLILDLDKYINSIQLKNNKSNGTIKANINSTSNKIKPLKYNKLTLPEVIFNHFWSFGTFYESTKQVFPPFSNEDEYLDNDIYYSYFYDVKDLEFFKNLMVNSELWTKPKYPQITTFDLMPVIMPYAKGFTKGYSNFTNGIKKTTELFNLTDTDIAYKVFERVYVDKEKETERFYLLDWIISNKTKSGLATNIDSNTLFRLGVYNGEFFKAWELILANPMKFEEFFKFKEPINRVIIDSINKDEEKMEKLVTYEINEPDKIVEYTIDITKYDPDKIYHQCIQKKVIKCDKDIFDAWLVNGTGAIRNDKIKWLFDSKNKRQLKFFMCEITGKKVSVKQMNMIFDIIVDTDNRPGKLDDKLLALLTLCNIKFSQKK